MSIVNCLEHCITYRNVILKQYWKLSVCVVQFEVGHLRFEVEGCASYGCSCRTATPQLWSGAMLLHFSSSIMYTWDSLGLQWQWSIFVSKEPYSDMPVKDAGLHILDSTNSR